MLLTENPAVALNGEPAVCIWLLLADLCLPAAVALPADCCRLADAVAAGCRRNAAACLPVACGCCYDKSSRS